MCYFITATAFKYIQVSIVTDHQGITVYQDKPIVCIPRCLINHQVLSISPPTNATGTRK